MEDNKCPECRNIIVRDKHELVCENCGLIIDDHNPSPGPSKTELGSFIDGLGPEDWTGVKSFKKRYKTLHENISGKENLEDKINFLKSMYIPQGAPSYIIESAIEIFKKIKTKYPRLGGSDKHVAAAALYTAYKMHDVPRTLEEIAVSCLAPFKEEVHSESVKIGRLYKTIKEKLKLNIKISSPEDYVPRYCGKLILSREAQNKTYDILQAVRAKELLVGHSPEVVAAAAIYIASILCNERKNQHDIANVSKISEMAIRKTYKEITERTAYSIIPAPSEKP